MIAIIGMRLSGYLRAYHAVAPAIAGLVVLATLYGGGVARPEEAYGISALVLFPILAWQSQILFDAEPDVQRRLMRAAAGSAPREISAGLLAAAATAAPTLGAAMILPWIFHSVGSVELNGQPAPLSLGQALTIGIWAHLLVIPAAVGLGGWASRAVSKTRMIGVLVLVLGTLLAILFGLKGSPVPFLAPPLMATARATSEGISTGTVWGLTIWALLWSAVALGGYWRLRLRRV